MASVQVERLDHLGLVADVCQEIGLAAYLDRLAGPSDQQVSVGTATVAMILNGLGCSNRRLYLVSQFFATKPVKHLCQFTAESAPPHHGESAPAYYGQTAPCTERHEPTTRGDLPWVALRGRRLAGLLLSLT